MDNREKILSCALRLFYHKGYDAVGVQEIATAAGVTKPTLYYYFGSKHGLLESVVRQHAARLFSALDEARIFDGDLRHTLVRVARVYSHFSMEDREFYFFMLSMMYSARESETFQTIHPLIVQQHNLIAQIFLQAEADPSSPLTGRHHRMSAAFTGMINHYMLMVFETGGRLEAISEEVMDALVHQFLYGIDLPNPSPQTKKEPT